VRPSLSHRTHLSLETLNFEILVFGRLIYVRQRPDCLLLLMFQCSLRRMTLEINMFIGGGILGAILVVALVFYVLRRA
jgi:hypothetical protein